MIGNLDSLVDQVSKLPVQAIHVHLSHLLVVHLFSRHLEGGEGLAEVLELRYLEGLLRTFAEFVLI